MTIWLLAVLLLASLAGLGYRQGAIRVAFSFLGIVIGMLLAPPLGKLLQPLLVTMGVKNVVVAYLIAPAIVFVLISIAFKVGALTVHQKAEVYYRYHAGDLRAALWERMNRRLGLCLGIANGALYLLLISFAIYSIGYATVQVATSEEDPRWMRTVNRLGRDLETTGFAKAARALDKRTLWYDSADLAGLLYHNPLLEARLSRYPAFLGLSESAEFKDIGSDKDFTELRDRKEPVMNLVNHPKIQAILTNPDLQKNIWGLVVPDMKDLVAFLETGKSTRYDREGILGRWLCDVNQMMVQMRRAKPNMSSKEAQAIKRFVSSAFGSTMLVAMKDQKLLLKNLPETRNPAATPPGAAPTLQNLSGDWKKAEGDYQLSFSGSTPVGTTVDGDRLRFNLEGTDLVFSREI